MTEEDKAIRGFVRACALVLVGIAGCSAYEVHDCTVRTQIEADAARDCVRMACEAAKEIWR